MIVEWDEKKNLQNIKKHKISFVQAAYVFTDPLRKEDYDAGIAVLKRIGQSPLVWPELSSCL